MGNSSYESPFVLDVKYKALCHVDTPNGFVPQGTIMTGEEWENIMVYEIGSSTSFDTMFEVVESLPKLYKKTSIGKIQGWEVHVEDRFDVATIVNNYGQVDGKIQESTEQVLEGKNIGKANETSAWEQAHLQAKARWEKQLKKGYVESIADAEAGKTDDIIEGGVFPILAHKFAEQGHKIKYPALAQPKLDGHRCTSQNESGSVTLWSRTRKPISCLPHIVNALENCYLADRFDGELYNHDYKDNFEELTSFINQKDEPKEGHEAVQYHVYDLALDNLPNYERHLLLKNLKTVETVEVNNEDELYAYLDDCLARGYEGCMVRNIDGAYKYKRSYDLQKLKKFDDDEFRIVDVKVGNKGSMAGKAVFICERIREDQLLPEGETFDVKMKGEMDKLKEYADDPSLVIGKILTVKYQGYTKKNSKPRFPVGERFRVEL